MQNEVIKQHISRFIDGDLGYNETLEVLKQVQFDTNLKATLCRYQAISQALKTDEFYQVNANFSSLVHDKIQAEPTYFLPQLKSQQPSNIRYPSRTKVIAVAASTLAVAVLVGQGLHDKPAVQPQYVAATTVANQNIALAVKKPDFTPLKKRHPLTAQFNDYLQAHNSSVYTNGEANFQPYATVTSYGQR